MPAWERLDVQISVVELLQSLKVAGAMTLEDFP
jgi:hypothetical protein